MTMIVACATMPTPRPDEFYMRHRATLKLGVQIVVVEFLHRYPDMANDVATIATVLQNELSGNVGDITMLNTLFTQHALGLQISPPAQLLLSSLGDALLEMVRNYIIERGGIPHDTMIRLEEVAGWIADSARMQAHP